MVHFFQSFFSNLRIIDALDILLLALAVYGVLTLIKGRRAVYMIIGLGIGFVFLWLTSLENFELYSMNWLLRGFFANLPLIIIVLFQSEIREVLTQVGRGPFFSKETKFAELALIEELTRTIVSLANKKIGALIVVERKADLSQYLETGITINSNVNRDLITSICLPVSPIHDGAIIIQRGKITKVGCFLPLTIDPTLSRTLGTRHRAAIGLTEEVDAVVIVVSEERGEISVVCGGTISKSMDSIVLKKTLIELLSPSKKHKKDEEIKKEVLPS